MNLKQFVIAVTYFSRSSRTWSKNNKVIDCFFIVCLIMQKDIDIEKPKRFARHDEHSVLRMCERLVSFNYASVAFWLYISIQNLRSSLLSIARWTRPNQTSRNESTQGEIRTHPFSQSGLSKRAKTEREIRFSFSKLKKFSAYERNFEKHLINHEWYTWIIESRKKATDTAQTFSLPQYSDSLFPRPAPPDRG